MDLPKNAPQPPCLTVENLHKSYPLPKSAAKQGGRAVKKALDGISFTLGPGLYGLLGPNGAGKSTLISMITCGLAPDKGCVLWNGKDVRHIQKSFYRILGYMPQQQGLYDSFTGRRFLRYFCALKQLPRAAVGEEITRAAQAVHLADELDKTLGAYSGGMKQRLLLAAALLGDPRLLILDEPTAGLDPKERVHLRQMLKNLSQGRIILLATHVVSDVESVADEILLLRAGKLVDKGAPARLTEAYAPGQGLEAVYLALFGGEAEL